jgi:hypothetical protein
MNPPIQRKVPFRLERGFQLTSAVLKNSRWPDLPSGFLLTKIESVFHVSFSDLQIYIDDFEEFPYTYRVRIELHIRFENNAH